MGNPNPDRTVTVRLGTKGLAMGTVSRAREQYLGRAKQADAAAEKASSDAERRWHLEEADIWRALAERRRGFGGHRD